MEIIYVLLPISVLLGLGALAAYLWSVKSGQYEDLDSPSMRVLFDDLPKKDSTATSEGKPNIRDPK